MRGVVVLDTNLLVLLIVGTPSRALIGKHDRLEAYSHYHVDLLGLVIAGFSEILVLPHVLAETSNLVARIGAPARTEIQSTFKKFVAETTELALPSLSGCARPEFTHKGLTDSMLLHVCSLDFGGVSPTLLTADTPLADTALSCGYNVIDFKREYQNAV